ncbi:MAG: hypothetical protein IPG16_13930 [Comamonadaceae bacterium]|nr:hypothetical protein [Comamonadaceae bacterium]
MDLGQQREHLLVMRLQQGLFTFMHHLEQQALWEGPVVGAQTSFSSVSEDVTKGRAPRAFTKRLCSVFCPEKIENMVMP